MTGPDSGRAPGGSRFFTVSDPEQARLLSEPRFQAAFRPFLAREASASAAAEELKLDLNAMLYRIGVLSRAGLLQVVREEKRQGRPIKIYRSVHDAYFIPYEVTPFADLEERLWQQQLPEARERARIQAGRLQAGGIYGQKFFRDEHGETWVQSSASGEKDLDWLDPERPASIDYWTDLLLTDGESREIQRLLYDLLQRYAGASTQGAAARGAEESGKKRYRLNVSFVPLDE